MAGVSLTTLLVLKCFNSNNHTEVMKHFFVLASVWFIGKIVQLCSSTGTKTPAPSQICKKDVVSAFYDYDGSCSISCIINIAM